MVIVIIDLLINITFKYGCNCENIKIIRMFVLFKTIFCLFFFQKSNYYGDLKDITVQTLTSGHSNKVSQFHKTLKNSTGKKLVKLQVRVHLKFCIDSID